MQGLMIIFFILQSFTFYVFPTFLDNKQLIQMAHGIFTVTFLLMLYFFLSFNDILLAFPRILSNWQKL